MCFSLHLPSCHCIEMVRRNYIFIQYIFDHPRVLKTLEGVRSSNFYLARQDKEASEEQQRKRRRIDTGECPS